MLAYFAFMNIAFVCTQLPGFKQCFGGEELTRAMAALTGNALPDGDDVSAGGDANEERSS